MIPHKIATIFVTVLLVFAGIGPLPGAFTDDPRAREIMEKVEARDDGDNQTADMEMILIDKRGNQRVRKIATFSKDQGADELRLMFFEHPADVKDTSFLTYDYDEPDKDDDQWLYLPALRKTKRIASSDKSGSFMGSDLNYSDMTDRNLDDYDFTLKKEMDVKGVKTWQKILYLRAPGQLRCHPCRQLGKGRRIFEIRRCSAPGADRRNLGGNRDPYNPEKRQKDGP
jgi:hypothetical protein